LNIEKKKEKTFRQHHVFITSGIELHNMRSRQCGLSIHKLNLRACNGPNKPAKTAKNLSTMLHPRLRQKYNQKETSHNENNAEELRPILSTPPEPASKTAKIAAEELANVLQVFIEVSCGTFCWGVHRIGL
jgi:hypothetical protein